MKPAKEMFAPAIRPLDRLVRRLWPNDAPLRARLINIAHLLSGNLIGSIVGVIGFVVTARALGPADYGVLALTSAIARIGRSVW